MGFTSQVINTRLRSGLSANGKNDYHGYKWKEVKELQLYIYVFVDSFEAGATADNKKKKQYYETIEAELLYQIRRETGEYPSYQNEVHFYNKFLNTVQETVAQIYKDAQSMP